MDPEKQVEQLQAHIESKDAQIGSLTQQTQELGAFKAEALNAREELAKLEAKVRELEAALKAAVDEGKSLKSAVSNAAAKKDAVEKKIAAAEQLSKSLRDLIG